MKKTATFQNSFSLKAYNSFGVEAKAAYFASPKSIKNLQELCREVPNLDDLLLLGGGSNILLAADYAGYVIHPVFQEIQIIEEAKDRCIWRVEAGVNWHFFVKRSVEQGWQGLENLALIPGNAGAAPIQNIGAYGVEIAEFIYAVEGLDLTTLQIQTLTRQACYFGYRDSIFKRELKGKFVITAILLELSKDRPVNIEYKALQEELQQRGKPPYTSKDIFSAVCSVRQRKLPDPQILGNAGSFFKNPEIEPKKYEFLRQRYPDLVAFELNNGNYKLSAGWLIEKCGWKGKALGRAAVHSRHALVLVNTGNATGVEILKLATAIENSVADTFGVTLEKEVNVVGLEKL
jgi:UDP-N-acetylmuramate dehydrogenase